MEVMSVDIILVRHMSAGHTFSCFDIFILNVSINPIVIKFQLSTSWICGSSSNARFDEILLDLKGPWFQFMST